MTPNDPRNSLDDRLLELVRPDEDDTEDNSPQALALRDALRKAIPPRVGAPYIGVPVERRPSDAALGVQVGLVIGLAGMMSYSLLTNERNGVYSAPRPEQAYVAPEHRVVDADDIPSTPNYRLDNRPQR